MALSLPVKTSATESDFACVNHLDWRFNVATKIIVNIDCQGILSVRKVLMVLRNVKERKPFLFFTEVAYVNYSDRIVFIKFRQIP